MGRPGPYESRRRARRRAVQALYQWQITGQAADEILHQFLSVQNMKGVDTAYFEQLLRGVISQNACSQCGPRTMSTMRSRGGFAVRADLGRIEADHRGGPPFHRRRNGRAGME